MALLRRVLVLSVVLALLIPLGGCWVYSMYPLAGPDDELVFDKFLAGHWWNPQNRCSLTFTRLPGEKAYRVVYITAKDADDNCWLGKDQSASFQGIVVELGGARFLDVVPADMPLQNHMALTHSFYRLKVDQNSLSLTPLNHQNMRSLVVEEKLRGVERSDEMLVLTASTKELRDFVRLNATNDDVWNVPQKLDFVRRGEGQ